MSIKALIIISCIVFVISVLLYLIVKNKEKFKTFILKLDDKLTKRYEQSNEKQKQAKENKEDVKQLTFSGKDYNENTSKQNAKIKPDKNETSNESAAKSKNSSTKKDEETKDSPTKLKPSKAVNQIRPVLLPPNEDAEMRDTKLLEMQKRPNMIEGGGQKALDFKYGARQNMVVANPTTQNATMQNSTNIQRQKKDPRQDFISFGKSEENFNPLKRDVKKQFDDIKNFLNLPENQETIKQKGVSYNGSTFNSVDKIDPSVFNSPEGQFVDYRNEKMSNNRPTSSIVNNFNNIINNKVNNTGNMNNQNNQLQNNNANGGNVMYTNTKYARNTTNQFGMPSFDLTKEEINSLPTNNNSDYNLTKEQENIDLNKLPNNLKKMIIQNILDRRNYD